MLEKLPWDRPDAERRREGVRHQAAIVGCVTDAATKQPVVGAQVRIESAPAAFQRLVVARSAQDKRPIDRTVSAHDGHFHFVDLPDGQYTLTASLPEPRPRYGKSKPTAVTVSRDAKGVFKLAKADIALPGAEK